MLRALGYIINRNLRCSKPIAYCLFTFYFIISPVNCMTSSTLGNPYFQFKQFTIHQDQCVMKVCTDACILGAWFAAKVPDHSTILDIGGGTGLLMMMMAQRSRSEIHSIEIDL